jgi:hypothetical protein
MLDRVGLDVEGLWLRRRWNQFERSALHRFLRRWARAPSPSAFLVALSDPRGDARGDALASSITMLSEQVDEIHRLRKKAADLHDEIERKIAALVIAALGQEDKTFSERELVTALGKAGFELPVKDAYPLLTRLANDQRIRREGPRYRAIRPDVLNRQLQDTSSKG